MKGNKAKLLRVVAAEAKRKAASKAVTAAVKAAFPVGSVHQVEVRYGVVATIKITGYRENWWYYPGEIFGRNTRTGKLRTFHFSKIVDVQRTAPMTEPTSLPEAIQAEVARLRNTMADTEALLPSARTNWVFYTMAIEAAETAVREQDTVAMVRLLPELRGME
jgi:hypothetical protein